MTNMLQAGTVMGLSGLFCYLTGAVVPHTVGLASRLLPPPAVWTALFITAGCVALAANTLFLLLGTADLQSWNRVGSSSTETLTEETPCSARHTLLSWDTKQVQLL